MKLYFKCALIYNKSRYSAYMLFPSDYPLVIAAALGMNWQTWAFGVQVGRFRYQTFNEDFMRKEWGTLHRNEIGEQIPAGGFPDTGSGVYSQRLSYRDWYRFNVLQRIHLNSVQGIALAQTSLLAAGIYKPREAALVGLAYILGRLLYSIGAKSKKGGASKARSIGFGLAFLAVIANSGIFFYHLVKHIKK